jgi:hypothetical protein
MGLVPAGVPRMSGMLDNLRIHHKFIAILLPPVRLAALAAGRLRANVTVGARRGGGVDPDQAAYLANNT